MSEQVLNKKIKLLIVDDSSVMRRTIEKMLSDKWVEIIGRAENGLEAINLVKSEKPDIITLDITMPQMDGLTCLEKIKQISPQTKVIVITALSDKLTGLQALDKGARGYLFKPVSKSDLKTAFEKLLKTSA